VPHGPLDGTRHGKLVVKRLHQPHGAQRKDPAGRSQRGLGGRYTIISDDRVACQARSAQDVAGGLHDYALPFCTENARRNSGAFVAKECGCAAGWPRAADDWRRAESRSSRP
jgi:hypothetical protein